MRQERQREKEVKEFVKERYAEIASKRDSCCPSCCACPTDIVEQAKSMGYSEQEIRNVPEGAVMGLGCGNLTALAELKEGETVLDFGSGGGLDVFLAAQKVGEKGKVIGVDMTPEMVEKAGENARNGNYKNVEFRVSEIENLHIKDWAECIAGAMKKQEYLNTIKKAGFRDVTIVAEHLFNEPGMDDRLAGKIISIQVEAYK